MIIELRNNKTLFLSDVSEVKTGGLNDWIKFFDENGKIIAMYNLMEIKGFYRVDSADKVKKFI